MNSFFPTQPHISRRSLGAVGLSVAASLGLPSAFAHADTADPTATGESSRLVLPPEGGFRLDSAEFSRLYGPGVFTMSTLYNVPVGIEGGMDKIASLRLRAVVSGTHLPVLNGAPLAQTHFTPGLNPRSPRSLLDDITFEQNPRPLVPGELYHVVLENVDPQPSTNFISVNNVLVPRPIGRPARWLNDTEWGTLLGRRAPGYGADRTWLDLTATGSGDKLIAPIMQLTTTDGASQGSSDMESGSVDPGRTYEADAAKPIRERFTPSADKRVTGVSVAVVATVVVSLRWRLLEGSQ